MHVVTSREMRELDRYTIETIGIPSIVLMENAAQAVAKEAHAHAQGQLKNWLILAGKGNNGGDAAAVARHLSEWGHHVHVVYAESPQFLTGDAAIQRDILQKLGISVTKYQPNTLDWRSYDGVIDGLLGTGTKGAPKEPYASLINEANASGLPILSIDIPSGLDADTGAVGDPCIRAVRTVTIAFMKRGLVQYPGTGAAGETTVAAIGIRPEFADRLGVRTFLITEGTLKERLGVDPTLPRNKDTHKGTYGHLLVAAGSRRMTGAGLLCSKAALRTGCGLVTWAVPDSLMGPLTGHLPEVMLSGLPDAGTGQWGSVVPEALLSLADGKDAVAVGPGLGQFEKGAQWLQTLWEGAECPLVLDADALNMLAGVINRWPVRKAPTVLTPHPGEMARLLNVPVREVQANRIEAARQFAEAHQVTLVLKGAQTVIATPEGAAYINTTGNPGMATGGAGDVLTGMIGSLLAQGYNATQAACAGVYLHGQAGDQAASRRGMNALIASDIIDAL
ncbi:NAD(P)H-hydrate dehydratase [Effusibacillus lacus]|uniref:Bifunctional NAD(P)H-hydrate repair enzyme n=1 Tax=Effusibacillus lacus TaxID=1348429 RepID=A0A292YJ94_9BACL|nr:NAD(P)H-hydrate dehydratase [Effusibacillus lacus]TCS74580.1 NAD(P)H-hydrate epimerase [Effusibacillus lacus]GAX88454.1 hypothetical protein EFBL_0063 [Effusibacillus lacus]